MITTANITMQFGAKPLFENISVKFGGGNRYGLIGASGCGKSTFMNMEAIEALNLALEHFGGTLVFVSHDREFVSSLADHIIEIKHHRLEYFQGTYDEYLASHDNYRSGRLA